MSEIWQSVKEIFGLVSLALLPFGVFSYMYSSQLLSDLENLPDEVIQGLFLFSTSLETLESRLVSIRAYSGIVVVIGTVFLMMYVLNYVRKPEAYADVYQKELALFGAVGGLLWMAVIAWWGYLPASSAVAEYRVIAEHNPGVVEGVLARGTSNYEIAVFDRAATGAAISLGFVWWSVSVVSLVVTPYTDDEDGEVSIWGNADSYISMRRKKINRDGIEEEEEDTVSYCSSCGSELPSGNVKSGFCPDCGNELN